jgi:hypothetical protein
VRDTAPKTTGLISDALECRLAESPGQSGSVEHAPMTKSGANSYAIGITICWNAYK